MISEISNAAKTKIERKPTDYQTTGNRQLTDMLEDTADL